MKASSEKMYLCEGCGKAGLKIEIEDHEPECLKRKNAEQKYIQKFRKKLQQRINDGIKWAKKDPAMQLLTEHGLISDAELLCKEWIRNYPWSCGTNSGFHDAVNKIVRSLSQEA